MLLCVMCAACRAHQSPVSGRAGLPVHRLDSRRVRVRVFAYVGGCSRVRMLPLSTRLTSALCMPRSCSFLKSSFTRLWCACSRFRLNVCAETAELKKLDSMDAPFDPKWASGMHVAAGLLQTTRHYQDLRSVLDSACSEIAGLRKTLFDKSKNRKQIPTRSSN
jgi:hypothetical protein